MKTFDFSNLTVASALRNIHRTQAVDKSRALLIISNETGVSMERLQEVYDYSCRYGYSVAKAVFSAHELYALRHLFTKLNYYRARYYASLQYLIDAGVDINKYTDSISQSEG